MTLSSGELVRPIWTIMSPGTSQPQGYSWYHQAVVSDLKMISMCYLIHPPILRSSLFPGALALLRRHGESRALCTYCSVPLKGLSSLWSPCVLLQGLSSSLTHFQQLNKGCSVPKADTKLHCEFVPNQYVLCTVVRADGPLAWNWPKSPFYYSCIP